MDFMPNIPAIWDPTELRDDQALVMTINSTYSGNRAKKPAMATSRSLLRKVFIGPPEPLNLISNRPPGTMASAIGRGCRMIWRSGASLSHEVMWVPHEYLERHPLCGVSCFLWNGSL